MNLYPAADNNPYHTNPKYSYNYSRVKVITLFALYLSDVS